MKTAFEYESEIAELKAEIAARDRLMLNQIRVDQREAGRLLGGVSVKTLEVWRREGTGPKFQSQGRTPFYTIQALKDWVENQPEFSNNSQLRFYLSNRVKAIQGTGTDG